MGTGAERPTEPSNAEIMVTLEDLQERLDLLQEMTEQVIKHLTSGKIPEWRRPGQSKEALTKENQYPCGCIDVSDLYSGQLIATTRCPAHMGIANMAHPESP